MKKNRYTPLNLIAFTCSFLGLVNACNLADKFPSKVSDIDTLAVYKKYLDSLEHENLTPPPPVTVTKETSSDSAGLISSADTDLKPVQHVNKVDKWTICLGTFKIKENAERKIKEISRLPDIHYFSRNNLFYVTIGLTESREASVVQKQTLALPQDSYIMKLVSTDILLPANLK